MERRRVPNAFEASCYVDDGMMTVSLRGYQRAQQNERKHATYLDERKISGDLRQQKRLVRGARRSVRQADAGHFSTPNVSLARSRNMRATRRTGRILVSNEHKLTLTTNLLTNRREVVERMLVAEHHRRE